MRAKLVIQNFGETMAKDTKIWINGDVAASGKTDFPPGEIRAKTVIMPNETLGFEHDFMSEKAGTWWIYLWGRIDYNDVFGVPHWTTFRFIDYRKTVFPSPIGEDPISGWRVKHCDEGNDAT